MIAIEHPFAAAYELELDVELPAASGGPLQLFYPGATETSGSSDLLVKMMEASAGFEPAVEVLQTSALPLG